MFRKISFLLLLFCFSFQAPALEIKFPFHAGELINLERSENAVKIINHEKAIQGGFFKAGENKLALSEELLPEEDEIFIILTVKVSKERSIGRLDYLLRSEDQNFPCLAMAAENDEIFDFRFLECRGPAKIRLLFSCPAKAKKANLKAALENFPFVEIPLAFFQAEIKEEIPPAEPREEKPEILDSEESAAN